MSFRSARESLGIISEAHKDFDKLASPEARRAVEVSRQAMQMTPEQVDKLGVATGMIAPDEVRAKFKVEITFLKGRTTLGPNLFGLQVWESGRRLNGDGDDLAFWCKDTESPAGCGGLILSDHIRGGVAFCPNCQRAIVGDRLTNMLVGRFSTKNLSEELAKIFHKLDSNADIYLKFHRSDVHYKAMVKAKGHETAARLKGMHIYPLKNILKDTSNGASLSGRFYAFLTS